MILAMHSLNVSFLQKKLHYDLKDFILVWQAVFLNILEFSGKINTLNLSSIDIFFLIFPPTEHF